MDNLLFILVGALAGALSGLIGVGGGVLIIPALLLLGFSQKLAQGTSIAVMLPPVGILAALTYYKTGLVNIKAAILIGLGFLGGALLGANYAAILPSHILQKSFGAYLIFFGIRLLFFSK